MVYYADYSIVGTPVEVHILNTTFVENFDRLEVAGRVREELSDLMEVERYSWDERGALTLRGRLSGPADSLYRAIRARVPAFYDDSGAIGRRYRRQDEAGTPFCFTVDNDTMTDRTVTVRDRDSMQQERISMDRVPAWLAERLAGSATA